MQNIALMRRGGGILAGILAAWLALGTFAVAQEPPPAEEPIEVWRDLTLKLSKHVIAKGTLDADDPVCASGQVVQIQRQKNGWKTVRTATTSAAGTFKVKLPDKEGKYRAAVATGDLGGVLCEEAASSPSRHKHRKSGGGNGRKDGCSPTSGICVPGSVVGAS